MTRTFALILAVVAALGCGKTRGEASGNRVYLPEAPNPAGPGRARGPITNEDQAIRKFRLAWTEEVVPSRPGYRQRGDSETYLALTDAGVTPTGDKHQSATAQSCAKAAKTYEHVEAASPGNDRLNDFGSHATLAARDGDCWLVHSWGWPGTELSGFLSANDGALLWVFVSPEG